MPTTGGRTKAEVPLYFYCVRTVCIMQLMLFVVKVQCDAVLIMHTELLAGHFFFVYNHYFL
jgi:hypothetical protein